VGVTVNFDQGLPDPSHFPVVLLRQLLVETLEEDGAAALTYYGRGGPSEMQYGYLGLREQVAAWMGRRDGREVDPEGVVLANGSTDGLALAINAYLGPGDGAVVEAATYPYTRRFMVETGAAVCTVPLDEQGMVVDALPDVLAALRDDGTPPRLIATIPSFHSPTGTLLPLARRERLLELAHEWDFLVLEDNCYHAFFYDAPPPATLLALDDEGRVLQSDTFSKSIAPGLRMAWVAGTPRAVEPLTQVRQDFAVSQLLARALERYLAAGHLDTHLAELRDVYRHKRDITAAALRAHCSDWVRFAVPGGGFYFWLELADTVDWDRARVLAAERGVACRPGDTFVDDDRGRRFLRLSPIQVPDADIEPGIVALAGALRDAAQTRSEGVRE
jgi:2-aminoadipate transaminase